MSGGVDSSVAAYLLKQQGYDCVGVFMKNWDDEQDGQCTAQQDYDDVRAVCDKIGIPYYPANFEKEYWDKVFSLFLQEYSAGRTPNPDVLCNKEIKFDAFLNFALSMDAQAIATGHYAQIAEHRGHYYLKNAVDTHKDQTYFLWMLTEENLRKTIFPLGHLTKPQVREIAREHGFETLAKKPESQDICFIPNNDYRTFLIEQGVDVQAGEYIDSQGKILGLHQGYCHYTIGQRKGLGIALGSPKFVTKINAEHNRVTLGERDDLLTTHATIMDVRLRDTEWLQESPEVQARIRYKSPAVTGKLEIGEDQSSVRFTSPVWGVTPGQSMVIYKDGLVVGGGIIC
jgi:tRNA-specific 2-thiouridylase